jgi:hypothetical protein
VPEYRAVARGAVAGLTLVVALIALGVGNFWAFGVEGWRLHNGHVSNRAFFLPIVQHGWIAYGVAVVVCGATAIYRWMRTPLTGGANRYASVRGRSFASH